MSVNKCIFIGNVGKQPEIRDVSDTFKVANFSLACSEKWTDKSSGEKKEKTEWINCQASNKVADIVEKYVNKGDKLYIEGKFRTQSWEKDGKTFYRSFIQTDSIEMLGSRKENQAPVSDSNPQVAEQEDDEESDLPF